MTKKKVLVADDDTSLVMALTVRLRDEGFEVVTAVDGYQALEKATCECPDLIILDIKMPCGSGPAVQERLQKMSRGQTVPIIYLTGLTSPDVDELIELPGVFAVMHKPFDGTQLVETIREALTPSAA